MAITASTLVMTIMIILLSVITNIANDNGNNSNANKSSMKIVNDNQSIFILVVVLWVYKL